MSRLWRLHPRWRLRGQRGFTMAEVLVAIALTTLVGSGLVTALHQISAITTRGPAQLAVDGDLRNAMRWLAKDLSRAKTTDLVDGAPAVSCAAVAPAPCLTLDWTDEYQAASISHSATYALAGTDLRRTYDGVSHTIARNATAAEVSLQGRLVTVTLTSASPEWANVTQQFTHHFYLRPF